MTGSPRLIAHRGFAGVAPENTVGAAVAAAECADAIEIDVQPSASGDPVVFHDHRLDADGESRGVTDGAGYVWAADTATLRETRVLDTDEHVPTLDELLAALPGDTAVNVELKTPGTADLRVAESLPAPERDARRRVWQPFVDAVAGVLDDHPHDVLVSSFCEGALAAAQDALPDVPRGVLCWGDVDVGVTVARRCDAAALHPPKRLVLDRDEAGTDVVRVAREHGWDVNAWTVETWHEAARLRRAGVDGLIADYPLRDWSADAAPRLL